MRTFLSLISFYACAKPFSKGNQLEKRKFDKRNTKRAEKCVSYICSLGRRVDRMEKSIGSIVTKIDAVLAKLETMERGRNKRKATMSKILGTITESDGRKQHSSNPSFFFCSFF